MHADGASSYAIAKTLNSQRISRRHGRQFMPCGVRNILRGLGQSSDAELRRWASADGRYLTFASLRGLDLWHSGQPRAILQCIK